MSPRLWIAAALIASGGCAARDAARQLSPADPIAVSTLPDLCERLRANRAVRAAPATRTLLAVGSLEGALVGSSLTREGSTLPWRHAARVTQPPAIDGRLVVFGEATWFTALAADTGALRWRVPARGAELLAISSGADGTALLLRDPKRGQRSILMVDTSGNERFTLTAQGELGAPAAYDPHLLVPWGEHFVSALEADSGREVGRARTPSPVSHARSIAGVPFVGGPPFLACDGSPLIPWAPARRPLPGEVTYPPAPGAHPGADLTRVYVRPPPSAGAPSELSYLVTIGRVALGLDAASGGLLWVEVLPGAVLAAAALPAAFAACEAAGSVRLLDARTGASRGQLQLGSASPSASQRGSAPSAAALHGCALEPSSAGAPKPGPKLPTASLVQQLAQALSLADPDLAPAQRFLSRELAVRPEPEATRALIDLASRRSADRTLQREAEDLLAARRNGVEFMLEALAAGRDRGPGALPPLGALADALAALEEPRAAPLLATELNRPGHPPDALARAARALTELATPLESPELRVFFSLRRSTADSPELVEAVVAVARTLLRVGGERGQRLVAFGVRDPLTVPDVRAALTRELGLNLRGP